LGDFTTISSASIALRTLLETYITNDTVAPLAGVPIELRTPQELRTAGIQTAISLWLYRLARSAEVLNQPEQRIPPDKIKRRPFPLELHYLVTPLAPASADEQTLLGRVIQVFHGHPILRGADIPPVLAPVLPAELRVNFEALTLEELTRVWNALGRDYQLSVSYHVQLLEIESMNEPLRSAPVLVRDTTVAKVVG
jgi:hypothetical protein